MYYNQIITIYLPENYILVSGLCVLFVGTGTIMMSGCGILTNGKGTRREYGQFNLDELTVNIAITKQKSLEIGVIKLFFLIFFGVFFGGVGRIELVHYTLDERCKYQSKKNSFTFSSIYHFSSTSL